MTDIRIRAWQPSDTPELVALFRDSVHAVAGRDYTPAQCAAWAPAEIDGAAWQERMAANCTLVAERGGRIAGFAELDGEAVVHMLYVHKDHQRCGVAAALADAIETEAAARKFDHLVTHASLTARPFFEARDYRVERCQTVSRNGEEFTNFLMRKTLVSGA